MDDSSLIDVFISHHPSDAHAVQPLATSLSERGLHVRCGAPASDWPQQNIERSTALAGSKAFVAWLSAAACHHASAQREFMLAFAAAAGRNQTRERIVVIDALSGGDASLPSLLRERCRIERTADIVGIAQRLHARVSRLQGPLQNTTEAPQRLMATREFAGRIGHLWHMHGALTGGANDTSRIAHMFGDPGAGKSWLADEYANAFGAAYPGGVFRLDAGWLAVSANDALERARELAWRQIALGLLRERPMLGFNELEDRVRQRLADDALPYLWIVDHVPAGQEPSAIRAWHAPTASGSTLIISRSEEYATLGTSISVGPLDRDSTCVLLDRHKPRTTEQDIAGARQLMSHLGCHALAMHLAGVQLTRSSYDRLLLQLAAPSRDAAQLADTLSEEFSHPQLVGIAVMLQQSVVHLSAPARHALRLTAVLGNAPVPFDLIATALAQQIRGSSVQAVSHAQIAADELLGLGLADRASHEGICVSRLVRAAALALDKPQEVAMAQSLLVSILASELPQCPEANDANPYTTWIPHALHLARTAAPGPQLIEINAWLARFDQFGSLQSTNRRAVTLLERGELSDAEELLDMELAACRMGLGDDHPQTVTPVNNLAVALSLRGEFAQARTLLEQAIEVRRKALGERHADLLTPLNNLGVVLWHEGDHRRARMLFERVVELRRQLLGDTHPDTLVSMRNLAVALRNDGEYVGARTLLEHVVEVRRKSLGTQHADTCTAMASLAETLREHSEALLARISETLAINPGLLDHDQAVRPA
jgi:tetratricopeptide (TPR) repeat protein